ncbi:hypothetical protein MIND_00755900 [Mycena indigotica]|uniref:DUF6534 domain-containing protein n=1 Tax=Mycena indigotica TaxID=2126181 RepID=A0A8H6W799_9AGAR|nr:uncharacterized protein MIND_00755900 [Mycena indigotica]KAF7301899.1 hypothetical protein MIND_00755900 [Mycena indigotica]
MSRSAPAFIAEKPIDYEYTIPGAILMDGLLHSFCIGFVLAEGLKYWDEYKDDVRRKRVFVLLVVLLSLLQTVLQDYKVWTVAVLGSPWASSPLMWCDFFINAVICSMCEAFYIRRSWKMTGKSPAVLYPMSLLWLGAIAAHLYITITLALEFQYFTIGHIFNKEVESLFRNTVIVFSYWIVGCTGLSTILFFFVTSEFCSTVLDLSVAIILIIALFKSKTGLDSSDTAMNRVILMTLETALLPSISMVTGVVVLHAASNPGKNDDLVLFFVFITAKLYAIGLLRTLNSRHRLRQRLDSTDIGRTTLGKWTWDQNHHPNHQALEIVEVRTERDSQLVMDATLRGSLSSTATAHRYQEVDREEVRGVERKRGMSKSRLRVASIHGDEEENI